MITVECLPSYQTETLMHAYVCRFGSPFAVRVSRDVSNDELRATLIDCMQDMFKDSAFSQVFVWLKILNL